MRVGERQQSRSVVYTVRPLVHHFALWVLLAPIFLFEAQALEQLVGVVALQDAGHTRAAVARVEELRDGARGPEVRYSFSAPGRPERFTSLGTAGWGETWVPLSEEAARQAASGRLMVLYLPESPAINQPLGRAGHPIGDSALSWALFLAADLAWAAESLMIVLNFQRCLAAAERREERRLRFWRTAPLPTAVDRYRGLRAGG